MDTPDFAYLRGEVERVRANLRRAQARADTQFLSHKNQRMLIEDYVYYHRAMLRAVVFLLGGEPYSYSGLPSGRDIFEFITKKYGLK